jgi:mitochondrial fission protein ELM1
MNQLYYNDQAYIAGGFHLNEDYISQTAKLAYFKINSYKLTLIRSSLRKTRDELRSNIKNNLFNYTNPAIILADIGFFQSEYDN